MTTTTPKSLSRLAGVFLSLWCAQNLVAADPAPTKPASADNEQVVELSPFEVRVDKDRGYGALQSNSR